MPVMRYQAPTRESSKPVIKRDLVPKEASVANMVDNRYVPSETLLTHIEGSSWTVNYYRQILSDDETVSGQQLGELPVQQQYQLFMDFELKVTGDLSPQIDEESQVTIYTGESVLYPGTIPNAGDMFLGDVGDGRVGVFEVLSTTRMSIYREACYTIQYKMQSYLDAIRQQDLDSKVVERLFFKRERVGFNDNPVLTSNENQQYMDLNRTKSLLIDRYFKEFFSSEFKTLLCPGNDSLYDVYLVKFITTIVGRSEAPKGFYPEILELSGDIRKGVNTLWDMLLANDFSLIHTVAVNMREVRATEFAVNPFYNAVALSGIAKVVYPALEFTHSEKYSNINESTLLERLGLTKLDDEDITYSGVDIALHYTVNYDSAYVLSNMFYESDLEKQSRLEWLVTKYISHEEIPLDYLTEIVDSVNSLTPYDRFYLVPIILVLITSAIKDF